MVGAPLVIPETRILMYPLVSQWGLVCVPSSVRDRLKEKETNRQHPRTTTPILHICVHTHTQEHTCTHRNTHTHTHRNTHTPQKE